jgi:hypothetical protein
MAGYIFANKRLHGDDLSRQNTGLGVNILDLPSFYQLAGPIEMIFQFLSPGIEPRSSDLANR